MGRRYCIYLVEDEPTIACVLREYLTSWDFDVQVCRSFQAVTTEVNDVNPDLILLDITLPFYNGYYWCDQIRQTRKTPIMFISSASDPMNMVMAMNMGADDFISKPFQLEIVVAKIQALLRRTYQYEVTEVDEQFQQLFLKSETASLQLATVEIALTKNEFLILRLLFRKQGTIVTREKMMRTLWQDEHYIDENTLSVNISRIRKKLEQIGYDTYLQTKKGLGYMLGANSSEE